MEQFTQAELQKLRECMAALETVAACGDVDFNPIFGINFTAVCAKLDAMIPQAKQVHEMSDAELFVLINNESSVDTQGGQRATAADELMRRYGIVQAMCLFADWQAAIHAAAQPLSAKKPSK